MKIENRTAKGGVGILTVMQIVFITLKLCNLIDWAWPIVLIPLWIQLGIIFILLVVLVLILIIDSK